MKLELKGFKFEEEDQEFLERVIDKCFKETDKIYQLLITQGCLHKETNEMSRRRNMLARLIRKIKETK